MSKKRVTVTIDNNLDKLIRDVQVDLMASTQHGWSYSAVLEILVEKGLEFDKKSHPKARES